MVVASIARNSASSPSAASTGAGKRHQHGKLAVGQAKGRKQTVKSARQFARRALGGEAEAFITNLQNGLDGLDWVILY